MQDNPREHKNSFAPQSDLISVSVIIPLYNAEKYIGECLDSLLAQTFQNFEVIVVDDCSTDNSVAIVKDYVPKFNGRLLLTKTEKNSGSGGYIPRNIGLKFSRGEYIQFLDSDDMLTKTALEELTKLAKEYDAEVVYCEKHFRINDDGTNMTIRNYQNGKVKNLVNKPTLETEDLRKRIQKLMDDIYYTVSWNKLTKRNLIMEHNLFFPALKTSGDNIWNQACLFYAKKFLLVPNATYIYRLSGNSLQREERTPQVEINFRLNPVLLGLKSLDDFMIKHEFFQENPECRFALLKKFIDTRFNWTKEITQNLKDEVIYSTIKEEFSENFGEYDVLIPALCAILYNEKNSRSNELKTLREFINYFSARIDIQFESKEKGNFQIVSLSDNKAKLVEATWLKGNNIGYYIHSHAKKLKIVANASVNGKIRLILRGIDVRDPKDNSKRIPYWIDYTKLTVNSKVIFDKTTPAWHDKSYHHTFDVKAAEEIDIETEWLPHNNNVPTVATPQVKPLADKFLPYLTGRTDFELTPKAGTGELQIISVSDKKADLVKASWLKKGDSGYVLQSHNGNLEVVTKATADGQLTLRLRGLWILDPADNSKLFPYWIDYTKLTVNGKVIFDKTMPAWYDEPYNYTLEVKADEEIKISVEWLPHSGDTQEKVAPIADKFLPYLTGRADIQLTPKAGTGELQIISVSDKKADVAKAFWLAKNEIGYAIQSHVGNMEIVTKVTADGQFNLKLRGMWVQDPADNSKLIPYRIDYTKLTVNGKVIFDKTTPAWHDEPYDYTFDVNAGEEIRINVEWLPHRSDT